MKKVRKAREPTKASLREIPEIDFQSVTVRRNPYAEQVAASGIIHVRRGRPRKGTETGVTEPRSVRFPARPTAGPSAGTAMPPKRAQHPRWAVDSPSQSALRVLRQAAAARLVEAPE